MTISPGKLWGLRRLADSDGFWRMVATDQREMFANIVASSRGVELAPYDDVAALITAIVTQLQGQASAILLDPIYGYLHTIDRMDPHKGLMLSYESLDIDRTPGGLTMGPIPGWSVEKIRYLGADAVKVLALYRADASDDVRRHQEDFVQAAGDECERLDIPMLLEILVYPAEGESTEHYTQARAQLVVDSLVPFRDPKFKVDIFKLEPPGRLRDVPAVDTAAGEELLAAYHRLTDGLPAPWVLLSAGMNKPDFRRSLDYAYRCGASGYLAGRALWSQAPVLYPDTAAITESLHSESVPYMEELNSTTRTNATPWHQHPSIGDLPGWRRYPLDRDFARHYLPGT